MGRNTVEKLIVLYWSYPDTKIYEQLCYTFLRRSFKLCLVQKLKIPDNFIYSFANSPLSRKSESI